MSSKNNIQGGSMTREPIEGRKESPSITIHQKRNGEQAFDGYCRPVPVITYEIPRTVQYACVRTTKTKQTNEHYSNSSSFQ